MTLRQVARLYRYWKKEPPTYQLMAVIARFLGWQPSARTLSSAKGDADPTTLLMSGIFAPASGEVARDFAELARLAGNA